MSRLILAIRAVETARPGVINANKSATTAPAPAPVLVTPAAGGVQRICAAEFDRIVLKTSLNIDRLGGAIDPKVREAIVDAWKGMRQRLRSELAGRCARGMHVLYVLCLGSHPMLTSVSSALYLQGSNIASKRSPCS
jgi:hypothetical protein